MYATMLDAEPPGQQDTSATPAARPGARPQPREMAKPRSGRTVYLQQQLAR
jgi:hypothetical protein